MTFGRYLSIAQVKAHETQEQLAAALCINVLKLDAWEYNRAVPSPDEMRRLEQHFGADKFGSFTKMPEPRVLEHYNPPYPKRRCSK